LKIIQILLAGVVILAFIWGRKFVRQHVEQVGKERGVDKARVLYVQQLLSFGWAFLAIVLLSIIADVGMNDFGLFFSSVFAVMGVALFAQWSILSNITASVVVFFFFPYRVGDTVKVLDGDNSVSGEIVEIALFHVILIDDDGQKITFPNALVFQKTVVINPLKSPSETEHHE
jgi:small-conductance mechanosensitive channel